MVKIMVSASVRQHTDDKSTCPYKPGYVFFLNRKLHRCRRSTDNGIGYCKAYPEAT